MTMFIDFLLIVSSDQYVQKEREGQHGEGHHSLWDLGRCCVRLFFGIVLAYRIVGRCSPSGHLLTISLEAFIQIGQVSFIWGDLQPFIHQFSPLGVLLLVDVSTMLGIFELSPPEMSVC